MLSHNPDIPDLCPIWMNSSIKLNSN